MSEEIIFQVLADSVDATLFLRKNPIRFRLKTPPRSTSGAIPPSARIALPTASARAMPSCFALLCRHPSALTSTPCAEPATRRSLELCHLLVCPAYNGRTDHLCQHRLHRSFLSAIGCGRQRCFLEADLHVRVVYVSRCHDACANTLRLLRSATKEKSCKDQTALAFPRGAPPCQAPAIRPFSGECRSSNAPTRSQCWADIAARYPLISLEDGLLGRLATAVHPASRPLVFICTPFFRSPIAPQTRTPP
ncbi:MAG: hypothetical protein KatS3mg058_0372 [Roseiflexus sp.]|nr:MAG: hypothetical protein KatS3mg058_0372 [Roseiflexus sp.]